MESATLFSSAVGNTLPTGSHAFPVSCAANFNGVGVLVALGPSTVRASIARSGLFEKKGQMISGYLSGVFNVGRVPGDQISAAAYWGCPWRSAGQRADDNPILASPKYQRRHRFRQAIRELMEVGWHDIARGELIRHKRVGHP